LTVSTPSVKDYVDLADLAKRLTAYRYRVFTAATQLAVGLGVAVLYMMWQTVSLVAPGGWKAVPLLPVVFFLSFFIPLYLIASFIWRSYVKSVRTLNIVVLRKDNSKKIYRLIPLVYAIPITVVYLIPPPLPHWYSYAWFYGLTVAHVLEALFFEIPLARRSSEFATVSHRVTAVLNAAASPIPAAVALKSRTGLPPAHVAVITALVVYLVAAMIELKRAEKLT